MGKWLVGRWVGWSVVGGSVVGGSVVGGFNKILLPWGKQIFKKLYQKF